MSSFVNSLPSVLRRIEARTAKVGIVGLGYVGLPPASACVEAGATVVGVDSDAGRVAQLTAGRSPVDDYHVIRNELSSFNRDLVGRPEIVAMTKADLPDVRERLNRLVRARLAA